MQILLKIVFTLMLSYGIVLVWTHEININKLATDPFKKLFQLNKKAEVPRFQSGLLNTTRTYKKGLNINGVEWQNDYQEFRFVFDNLTQNTEITNFRIDLQIPGGVVFFEKQQSFGFDDLDIYSGVDDMGISQGNQINQTVKTYSNHLQIKATKVFPNSHITIKLIIKTTLDHNNGFVKYNYEYINENNNRVTNDFVYLMPFKQQDDFVFFSVNKDPVNGKYDYNVKFIPDRPLIFKKDGTVAIATEKDIDKIQNKPIKK